MPIELIGPSPLIWKPKMTITILSAFNPLSGAANVKYNAERESGVRTSSDLTNMGAAIETYDPEWTAWLAGEI